MAISAGKAIGYLDLDFSGFSRGLRTAQGQLRAFNDTSISTADRFNSVGQGLKTIGSNMSKYVSVPLMAAGAASTKAAISFESAFAGVKKTVDTTEKELSKLEKGIRGLAKEMPTAATEIARVAEAAGQLGIEVPNILSFTKTMVMLGDSTNMSAEEAATSLARLANITGMSQTDFDKLGSTIVALGNNLATTEQEITAMGLRLAGAGAQVGMSEAQILSFAGALSSVGIEAEAGGSAFSKVMIDIQLATEKGGESLNNFAKVAGMSSAEFSKAFKEDAPSAIMAFIEGLGNAEEKGLSAIGILDDMGIKEVRLRDALLRAAGASDVFSEALEIGTEAWEENNALTKEAEQRYETTQSKLLILKNKLIDVGITIGNALIPRLEKMVDWLGKATDWFSKLDPTIQNVLIGIGSFAAAIGPALMIIGQMSIGIGALITFCGKAKTALIAFGTMIKTKLLAYIISFNMYLSTTLIPTLTATAFSIGAVTVPVWAVIAAIAALIGIGYLLIKNWDTVKEMASNAWNSVSDSVRKAWDNVKNFTVQAWNNTIDYLGNTWEGMKDSCLNAYNSITTYIQEAWNSVVEWTTSAWTNISNFIKNIWIGIIDFLSPVTEFIHSIVMSAWMFIYNTTTQIWNSILGILISVWEFIKSIINLGIALVELAVVAGWTAIKTFTESIWNGIKSFIESVWNAIGPYIIAAIEGVKTGITNAWNTVRDFTINTWNSVNEFLVNTWNSIKGFAISIYTPIKDFIINTWNTIKSFTSNVWSNIQSSINNAWNNIKSRVSEGINSVKSSVTSGFNSVKSFVTSIWNSIKSVIQSAWNGIKSVVSTGANLVKSTISSVFSTLTNIMTAPFKAAERVISGILGGLTGAINKVTSGIKKATGLFKGRSMEVSFPNPQYRQHEDMTYSDVDYSKMRFNYSKAKQTSMSDVIAKNQSMTDTIKNFTNNIKSENYVTKDIIDKLEKLYNFNDGNTKNNDEIVINIDGREVFRAMSPHMGRAARGV